MVAALENLLVACGPASRRLTNSYPEPVEADDLFDAMEKARAALLTFRESGDSSTDCDRYASPVGECNTGTLLPNK